jgi:hypothetical protein
MKNRIEDLRDHLFETIEKLKDDEKPMEIDRARAVADVAGKIIDSARVEVEHLKTLEKLCVRVTANPDGTIGSGFFAAAPRLKALK